MLPLGSSGAAGNHLPRWGCERGLPSIRFPGRAAHLFERMDLIKSFLGPPSRPAKGWKRRDFLRALVATPMLGGALIQRGTSPPSSIRTQWAPSARLSARPRQPFRTFRIGQTRIGQDLERGGYLFVPESYRENQPAPLLVALHGGGGHAGRWSDIYAACENRGIVLVAPDSRGRTWDRVNGAFGPDVAFIDAVLRFTFERCVIDPLRIALAGFSDGASYALSLGPPNGDLFSHLIAWSPGFSDPEDPIVGAPRVFVSHGSDDRVLPVSMSRSAIVPMFEMDGYEVTYFEFTGRHELTTEAVDKGLNWFLTS